LALATGTTREAVARQHWGKCLFEQERYAEAVEQFDAALRLRQAAGDAPDLLRSSAIALRRARELSSTDT
jgi:Flp pilus assembly protein TadD